MIQDWRQTATLSFSAGFTLLHQAQHLSTIVGDSERCIDVENPEGRGEDGQDSVCFDEYCCARLPDADKIRNAQNYAYFALEVAANPFYGKPPQLSCFPRERDAGSLLRGGPEDLTARANGHRRHLGVEDILRRQIKAPSTLRTAWRNSTGTRTSGRMTSSKPPPPSTTQPPVSASASSGVSSSTSYPNAPPVKGDDGNDFMPAVPLPIPVPLPLPLPFPGLPGIPSLFNPFGLGGGGGGGGGGGDSGGGDDGQRDEDDDNDDDDNNDDAQSTQSSPPQTTESSSPETTESSSPETTESSSPPESTPTQSPTQSPTSSIASSTTTSEVSCSTEAPLRRPTAGPNKFLDQDGLPQEFFDEMVAKPASTTSHATKSRTTTKPPKAASSTRARAPARTTAPAERLAPPPDSDVQPVPCYNFDAR
ncbi:hypothetical protein CSHISOI_09226, partial [Colletotrichum shisoi]